MASGENPLLPVEAEAYAAALECCLIRDIGNPRWTKQHEYLEKLNMQAILNASQQQDEYIKEFLISFDKIPVLIHELIGVEVWRKNVFSVIKKMKFEPKTSFPLYMVLYNEAVIINLLETIMFHKDSCESADENMLDLADYCYRSIIGLISRQESNNTEELLDSGTSSTKTEQKLTTMEELINQEKNLEFEISTKAISILQYITDHIKFLPLSVANRLLNTHDVPCLLVQLIGYSPWAKRNKDGTLKKFIDGKWHEVPIQDQLKVTKLEGQIWMALFNLLMGPECQQKYEFNSYNKNQLLKLRGHMNEVVLDQLPFLVDLQRYLEHLSMMEPPAAKKGLVLEQVPEVFDTLLKENDGKWGAIAKHQVKKYFDPSEEELREKAKRFAEMYDFDAIENMISEPPKCGVCGQPATKRCSRCQNEWYCRRECQVNHWPKHKQACNLMTDSLEKLKNKPNS